jgi:hypothetical protein
VPTLGPAPNQASTQAPCRNSMQKLPEWSRIAAEAAIQGYLRSMADALAARELN